MKKTRRRVALWNGSGMDNIGDQAIDRITRRELARRLPGAEFETFTPWPGRYCQNRLRIDQAGVWSGQGAFSAIVVGGGALLVGPPFRDPSSQFFLLGPAPALFKDDCPVLWNGVCSDSQHRALSSPRWREFMVEACMRVSYRAVRNERTRRFLKDCGVGGTIAVIPDICAAASRKGVARRQARRPTIAIAAGRPVFPQRFVSGIAGMAAENMGLCDTSLLDIRRYDEGRAFSDQRYAAQLGRSFAGLAAGADLVVAAFGEMYGDDLACDRLAHELRAPCRRLWDGEMDDVLDFFAGVDVVLGSRLHACILALSAGTPFVMVDPYYCPETRTSKMKEFAVQCGFERFYFTLTDVLEGHADIQRAVEDARALGRQQIGAVRERLTAEVDEHFDRLARMVP